MNPWCHRHVIYLVRCVFLSSFKHIFFREMNSLVTPKIFFFRRLTNSFFGLTFGATDKCFISSASSTCQVIFCLYGGQVTPSLFNFCIISEAVFYCSAAVRINMSVKQLLAFFQCFSAGTSCRCSAGSHGGVDDGNMFLIRKW